MNDGTGNELRKEQHEQAVVAQRERRNAPAVDVDQERDLLTHWLQLADSSHAHMLSQDRSLGKINEGMIFQLGAGLISVAILVGCDGGACTTPSFTIVGNMFLKSHR